MQLAGKTYDSLTPDGIEITDQLKIRSALASILESHAFRSSKQCRDLLSYVVEQSLLAETGVLRERVIGIEVFGRPANYNTSEDPVVRMRAADVPDGASVGASYFFTGGYVGGRPQAARAVLSIRRRR